MIDKHPKIFALGTRHVADIFDGPVQITEKVDGSQLGFAKIDGILYARSKNCELMIEPGVKTQSMFEGAITHLMNVRDQIPERFVFHGEWLRSPKHNTLAYDRTPENGIALFSAYSMDLGRYAEDHATLEWSAERMDMDVVPLIFEGETNGEDVLKMIEAKSYLGGADMEGVVIKNFAKTFMFGEQEYQVKCAKYVSEKFKEVHQKSWKQGSTGKGKWDVVKDSYCTEARWQKAVQSLRDAGMLQGEPRDIGTLVKLIQQDVVEECKEEIMEHLWRIFGTEVLRGSIRGFPEWYKRQLVLDGEVQ